MTSKRIFAVVFAALTVLSGAVAGVAVTGSAQAAPQDISSCTVIDEAGEYRLTNDIGESSPADDSLSGEACLEIAAENVTLDGDGHTVAGDDGYGVYARSDAIATLTDLTVSGWETGVYLDRNSDLALQRVTAENNDVGVETFVAAVTVEDSTVTDNAVGLRLGESSASSITDSDVSNNDGVGINADNTDLTVQQSTVTNNGGDGVLADRDMTLTVDGSVVADNGGLGINAAGSETTVDATGNYWGASDGPSSETSEPLEDPETGTLADGSGDAVSEGSEAGVSNVRFDAFLAENPLADDGDSGADDGDDSDDSDTTAISSCMVIDEAGDYELTNDITNESASICIDVRSENVTVDGNGHTIDGVDTDGRGVQVGANSVVTDVVVRGFDSGAYLFDGSSVRDSTFVDNTKGIETTSFGGTIDNTTVRQNVDGIRLGTLSAGTIVESRIVENDEYGVNAGVADFEIEESLFANNGRSGVTLTDGYITTENSTYRDNGGRGVDVGLGGVYSTGDTIVNNADEGIDTSGITVLNETTVENNGGDGISTVQTTLARNGLIVVDSVIRGNDGDGVRAEIPEGQSMIRGSVIADNGGLGVNATKADTQETNYAVDATGNYWGASDGPSSETSDPLEDPETGTLADGSGDAVSEDSSQSGVSNVRFDAFLAENPFTDTSDDDEVDLSAKFIPGDYLETNSPVEVGETLTVTSSFRNVGAAGSNYATVYLDTDGDGDLEKAGEQIIELGVDETMNVTFDIATDDLEPGEYDVLFAGDTTFVTQITITDDSNDSDADTPDDGASDGDSDGSDDSDEDEGDADDGDDSTDDGESDDSDESGDSDGSDESDDSEESDDSQDSDDSDDSDSSDDSDDSDDTENGDDVNADGSAYQIDVAAGDVIETLGDDEDDFYGTQGRLLQAQTVLADGTVTGTHMVPTGEVTKDLGGCMVSYTPVSYDAETGEVTLSVSVADDTDCEGVTLTVAGYELPGDDTTFVREHADGQELVDYETVTLDAGDSGTVTIDLTDESSEN